MNKPYPDQSIYRGEEAARKKVFALGLVAATVLAYLPAINGGFVFDDNFNVTDNLLLRSFLGLISTWTKVGPAHGGTIQYYPLTYSVFWIEYNLWRLQPLGYHLVNVLLHALSAVLVWRILRRLRVPGAPLAAAIFALHPVHVESVAWVTELKNVLAVLLSLLSLSYCLRFLGLDEDRREDEGNRSFYFAAILFFVGALASKSIAGTLPAAILLILWWKTGRIELKKFLMIAPMLILGAASGLMTAIIEKSQAGAQGREWAMTPIEHILLAARVPWFYASKLIWPIHLTVIYPRWEINQTAWTQYLYLPATLAVIAILWSSRHRLGRGPLTAILFFGGTLVPAMGFANVYFMRYSYVADHFQYPASLGLIALFSAAATQAFSKLESWTSHGLAKKATLPLAGLLLTVLGVLTWRQGEVYKGGEAFWADVVAKNPSAWMAQNNLGYFLLGDGRNKDAEEHLAAAVRLKSDYSDAFNLLGVALVRQGRYDDAVASYRQAIYYNPRDARAHCNLGEVLAAQGKLDEAITQQRMALEFMPDLAVARGLLDSALAAKARTAAPQPRRIYPAF